MLKIKKIVVGEWGVNCYLLVSDNELAVVDPGDEYEKIEAEIEKLGKIKHKYILLTHGHFDHIMSTKELKEKYDFQIVLGDEEKEIYEDMKIQSAFAGFEPLYQGKPDILIKDQEILELDEGTIMVIETPGHTKGSVSYLIGNNLFSGDTIFRQSYGRTDLPTGDKDKLWESLKKLTSLKDDIRICPGHGEETTVGEEKGYYE